MRPCPNFAPSSPPPSYEDGSAIFRLPSSHSRPFEDGGRKQTRTRLASNPAPALVVDQSLQIDDEERGAIKIVRGTGFGANSGRIFNNEYAIE